jgi:hypothetical protein
MTREARGAAMRRWIVLAGVAAVVLADGRAPRESEMRAMTAAA